MNFRRDADQVKLVAGDYTIVEGQALKLSAAGFGASAQQLSWTIDGHANAASGADPSLSWAELESLGVNDAGDYSISLQAIYAPGIDSATSAAHALHVLNTAPTATFSSNLSGGTVNEGGTAEVFFANAYDPSSADAARGFLYSIDFGNKGSFDIVDSSQSVFTVPASYLDDDRTISIRGRIRDQAAVGDANPEHVGYSDWLTTITVLDVPPTLRLSGAATVAEGSQYVLSFAATDPGNDPVARWTIDWSDGVIETVAGSTTSASHRFLGKGTYEIVATAQVDGAPFSTTHSVTVTNVVPVLQNLAATAVNEGGVSRLTGTIVDLGLADACALSIDWGDGSTPASVALAPGVRTFDLAHQYVDRPASGTSYLISATVSDGHDSSSATLPVTVGNGAPTLGGLRLSETQAGDLRETTLNGSFADPGARDTHTVVVDWGDSSSSTAVIEPIRRSFTATHEYALGNPNDSYTIVVTVDDGRDTSQASIVSDGTRYEIPVAPKIVAQTATTRQRASVLIDLLAGAVGSNGRPLLPVIVEAPLHGTLTPNGDLRHTYTYTPAGDFTGTDGLRYKVTDGVLDSQPAQVSLTVQNVVPVLTALAATTVAEGEASHLTGTIVDAGVDESYSLAVDWGDGSAIATYSLGSGVKAFDLTHQYQDRPTAGANYTIAATVSDGIDSSQADARVTVTNVAPTVSALSLSEVQGGGIRSTTLIGEFADPGSQEPYSATIDWGDGTISAATVDPI